MMRWTAPTTGIAMYQNPDMTVILVGKGGTRKEMQLAELLPQPFRFDGG